MPGVGPGESSTEFGDYDVEGDGQTLIYRDNTYADGPPPSLTYREVTNDGRTVDSQTVYYGTEISVRSHTENNPDGTFVSNTTTTDGGEVVDSQSTERTIVSLEELSQDLAPDAELNARELHPISNPQLPQKTIERQKDTQEQQPHPQRSH